MKYFVWLTLKGNTLEHHEQAVQNVVEISDAVVGVLVLFAAEVAFRALVLAAAEVFSIIPT